MKKPGVLLGALVSGLLTLPLLAVWFVGQRIAGFPFVPFNVFYNVRDNTPGGIITYVIESMEHAIRTLNLGRVDTIAKQIETAMSIGLILVIMVVAGAIFFAVMRRMEHRQEWLPGVIFGLVVGIPLTFLSLTGNQILVADTTTSIVWLLGLFLIWGYTNNWAFNKLTYELTSSAPEAVPAPSVSVRQIDRRQFLIQLGGATAAITVVGAFVGSMSESSGGGNTVSIGDASEATQEAVDTNLPNTGDRLQPAPGTRPEITSMGDFYRTDITFSPPEIDLATWTLPWYTTDADGNEVQLTEMTMDDIKALPVVEQYITQGCISNGIAGSLIGTCKWTGTSAQEMLKAVTLPDNATHLLISSADGFFETIALETINNDPTIMFGYEWDDAPLTTIHGFPLRIHISNLYGMKQPKWITRIDVLDHDVDGYWVVRGWDKVAEVRAVSVIDTVATRNVFTENDQQYVPVGGIAWAGTRGISKVEVSVDNGEWVEAVLREPLSEKTWVLWRYDWAFAEGSHSFAVRTYEGDGSLQITDPAPSHPSGATGIHRVTVTV
jgi:DMSO/TMAO reductase YedYZ molybdopterin-dependent catalytic subunit